MRANHTRHPVARPGRLAVLAVFAVLATLPTVGGGDGFYFARLRKATS